ncbi:MAG: DNA gyrase subunit A [Verrucomicrobiales bacterium]|nr:DNA gyrase subunit A [Verrucomicrobiales bacterium]
MSEHSDDSIAPINVADEMSKSFLDYSMSVIISRALPDARDGLKPSQRRLLYAMYNDLSLGPSKAHLKCARIVGDTMGKYHPHGDGAIYPTLVNMAQPWSMREILVEGQGNFGSVEGDPPAAMRYTEARLTHLGVSLMNDMDKDTVDFVPNYDGTRTEPSVLPAAFPNLLINGGTGIAVGMATNIPPHNLSEVIDALCAQIENPKITVDEINTHIKGPDFPTGCTILGFNGIRNYMRTGRGSVKARGRATIETLPSNRDQIIITEIPYNVNRATLVERIAELVNQKVLPEISAVRDESDENTRVVIDLKRDARSQVVLNNLYKHTQLETSFSTNMLAIDNRRPKLLNIKDALTCFLEHRREVIIRRTRYLLGKAEDRAEVLEAYLLAIANLDDFIKIIRNSANRDEAREKIKAYRFTTEAAEALGILIRGQPSIEGGEYVFTDRQVNSILELRLYQLTALERDKIKDEYDKVLDEIKDLLDILAKEVRVLAIIKEELLEVKEKYGSPRKTDIVPDEGEINIEDLIANESTIITISHRGFIKRTPAVDYRTQGRGGKGLKGMETRDAQTEEEESDFVEHLFSGTAHDYLLFFTNTGRLFVERVYVIPEMARTAKGRSIKNLLDLRENEKIASVLRLEAVLEDEGDKTWEQEGFILFATRAGTVKKTALVDYKNYRKGGLNAITIEEGNELIGVRLTTGEDDICLVTRDGLCVRTSESTIRSMGRTAKGVAGIRPRGEDYVVSLTIVDKSAQFLVASEKGLGKRTPFDDYPTKGRGGKGLITMKTTDRTGKVAGAIAVLEDDDVMLMTSGGKTVRIKASGISSIGRNAQGVKLVTLSEGEIIKDIVRVVGEDPEAEDSEDAEAEAPEAPGGEEATTPDTAGPSDDSADES